MSLGKSCLPPTTFLIRPLLVYLMRITVSFDNLAIAGVKVGQPIRPGVRGSQLVELPVPNDASAERILPIRTLLASMISPPSHLFNGSRVPFTIMTDRGHLLFDVIHIGAVGQAGNDRCDSPDFFRHGNHQFICHMTSTTKADGKYFDSSILYLSPEVLIIRVKNASSLMFSGWGVCSFSALVPKCL